MVRCIICGGRSIYEGEVLEVFVTKCRDRKAALAFIKRAMKRYGRPKVIVTDRLRSYRAAMNVHPPFRRREGAMAKFRDVKTLQKFVFAHASIHNHFNLERHLIDRNCFKKKMLSCSGRVASVGGLKLPEHMVA